MTERIVKGIVASEGVAIGKVYKFEKVSLEVPTNTISEDESTYEIKKFKDSIDSYIEYLNLKIETNLSQSEIFMAHIGMLEDPFLIETTESKINDEKMNAAMALKATADEIISMMESLEDPYLKERAADYKDIKTQLLHRILGIEVPDLSNMTERAIIVAEDLSPSDTSTMNVDLVEGIVTDLGGKTAHTSIIAQTLGIPALVGLGDVSGKLENGQEIIVDTDKSILIIDPSEETKTFYKKKAELIKEEKARLEKYMFQEAITKDGKDIEVFCNIGNLSDLELGISQGAEGVGLFRTEFLYMESSNFPDEQSQYEVYKSAAEMLKGKPLTIRTLDIGGDKGLPYFDFPKEDNPFLGWRALRICFDMPEVFKTQLRAILRASAHGKVLILLPMVISVDEIKQARKYIEECKAELKSENIPFDEKIEVGIMIETPASVIVAEDLIKYVDFFSIGTNDLTQYMLAADRGNQKVSNLYNSYNPVVLRSIKRVIDASHATGKWTGMCGGFASDTKATKLLLGLGLDEFSAVASNIAKIKDVIRKNSIEESKEYADYILSLESTSEIEEYIENI